MRRESGARGAARQRERAAAGTRRDVPGARWSCGMIGGERSHAARKRRRTWRDAPMAKGMDNASSIGLLLMRLIAGGLLFYGHGLPKILNWQERVNTFG